MATTNKKLDPTNENLVLPDYNEKADINVINSNFTKAADAVNALNSNKTDFYDAGNITATSESNAVALAIKAAFNAGFINATRKTAVVSFFYNTPWSVSVIDNYGSNHTFYFTAYTYNKVVQGYLGANDTTCPRFEELALNSNLTINRTTFSNGEVVTMGKVCTLVVNVAIQASAGGTLVTTLPFTLTQMRLFPTITSTAFLQINTDGKVYAVGSGDARTTATFLLDS